MIYCRVKTLDKNYLKWYNVGIRGKEIMKAERKPQSRRMMAGVARCDNQGSRNYRATKPTMTCEDVTVSARILEEVYTAFLETYGN